MTKKDLFDGLNYIDDQIIEEAQPTGESAGYSDEIYEELKDYMYGPIPGYGVTSDYVGTSLEEIIEDIDARPFLGAEQKPIFLWRKDP